MVSHEKGDGVIHVSVDIVSTLGLHYFYIKLFLIKFSVIEKLFAKINSLLL